MIEKVKNTITENKLINYGDRVMVGVSGGPDSICLLYILYRLRYELGIVLIAAHLNHCLRGEEADKDEEYVKMFCENLGIEFYSKKVDVNKFSQEKGISCEMAAREIRYDFFREISNEHNIQKVALAHNANDQAETVLMRIMRGTGLEGLTGIQIIRDEVYIRPIINITRPEIEKFCNDYNLNPRIDKTNLESIYSRNKVRLELLPYIQENFNDNIINTLNEMAYLLKKDSDYLESEAIKKYNMFCKKQDKKLTIKKEAFLENEAILTRILRIAIKELSGNLNNIEKLHIYDIIYIQKNTTGKEIQLPKNIIARNNYGDIDLYIYKDNNNININQELFINEDNIIEPLNIKISLCILNSDEEINLKKCTKNTLTQYFDYDKIKGNIRIRSRKSGDTIVPLGMNGTKKIKNIFIDLKVPREDRDNIPLICFNNEVAWIVGYMISEKFKIDKKSKNILKINVESVI